MQYYPVFLDLRARSCLVIGGGAVAERKVESLLRAHSQVTVVSPVLTGRLQELARTQAITVHQRHYRSGDLKEFSLVFAATDDEALQRQIAAEARAAGILLNVVDRPALCSFIVPAVVSRGELTLAISTGGASPALAKKIRQTLEQCFGPEYAVVLRLLARIREQVVASELTTAERQRLFTTLVDSPLLEYVREGQTEQINELLQRTVGKACTLETLGFPL